MAFTEREIEIMEETIRRMRRTPLVCVAQLAYEAQVSEATIRNRRKKLGIPWRNVNGHPWKEGDGPKRIARYEWENQERLHTNTVVNHLRDHERSF